jgi:WD40 repeat protein
MSGADDNTVCIWDAASGHLLGSPLIGHATFVTSVISLPMGNRLCQAPMTKQFAFGMQQVAIPSAPKGHAHLVMAVAFSLNGKHFVSASHDYIKDNRTICLWDTASGELIKLQIQNYSPMVNCLTFHQMGSRLYSVHHMLETLL